jgi:hypothetical protein
MGINYNTLVFYGVDLGDLTDSGTYDTWAPAWMLDDSGAIDDWDPTDHLARGLGWEPVPFPSHVYATEPPFSAGQAARDVWRKDVLGRDPDVIAYRANQEHRAELLKIADYGCSLDSYGHHEGDLALLVQVDASVVKGDVWRCVPIEHLVGADVPAWNAQLARYLDVLEIPVEHRPAPGWHLTGSVG